MDAGLFIYFPRDLGQNIYIKVFDGQDIYFKQEMFQIHICPPWCKIQNYYLYVHGMGANPAPSCVLIK